MTQNDAAERIGLGYYVKDVLIAGVPAIMFWILAEQFADHGFILIRDGLRFLAGGVLCLALPLMALHHWPRPKKIWSIYAVSMLIWASVFALSSLNSTEKSPLNLLLTSSDSPDSELRLNNKDLFWKSERSFVSKDAHECLLIPVPLDRTNSALEFIVENDSRFTYEDVEVSFVFSEDLHWSAPPPWQTAKPWPDGRIAVVFPTIPAVSGFEGRKLTAITFGLSYGVPPGTGTAGFVTAFIKAKDMKTVSLVFMMGVGHFKNVTKPLLVPADKKSDGADADKTRFTIP